MTAPQKNSPTTIRWHRRNAGSWYATRCGITVAHANYTGSHLDDYPWGWYLAYGIEPGPGRRGSDSEDTLRSCKQSVAGVLKEVP
jgi:hypothetical protein